MIKILRSEMIKELGISEMTLKKDINSILNKTGFDIIMEFAVYAAVNNFILPARYKETNPEDI